MKLVSEKEFQEMLGDAKRQDDERAAKLPDEYACLRQIIEAYYRLKKLGWNEASYCPKDGEVFQLIEWGSTGIFDCYYSGEWPNGYFMTMDGGDVYPKRIGALMYKKKEKKA